MMRGCRYLREVTLAQLRNPMRRFADRVRQLIFQDCYFYRPFSLRDLARVDPHAACAHFNRSFCNPAEFSICFTGSLKVSTPLLFSGSKPVALAGL